MRKIYLAAQVGALLTAASGFSTTAMAQTAALEEVIVTAQKRDQSSQDVPIAITAVSSADIERVGASELKDLQFSTPNLTVTGNNPNQQSYGLRGVSDKGRNAGYDQRIGVYVDGVWVGKSAASNQSTLDIASVEILRGPQGTLFGKNTVAGAININTQRPTDVLEGAVAVDVGNYGYRNLTATVNAPLAETVNAKVSFNKSDRDGYIDNVFDGKEYNNRDSLAFRAQVSWDMSDKTQVYFTADHYENQTLWISSEQTPEFELDSRAVEAYVVSVDDENKFDLDGVGGISMTIEHQLDNGFELTSISAYRYEELGYIGSDQDFSAATFPLSANSKYNEEASHFSQEIRLASPADEAFNYVVGLYYLKQNIEAQGGSSLSLSPLVAPLPTMYIDHDTDMDVESYAAFVHANYQLSESLQLTAGLRYTNESKDVDYFISDNTSFFISPGFLQYTEDAFVGGRSSSDVSPKISLNWFASEDVMVYGGYSKAFKSGGYNADWIASLQGFEFDDESVDAYELGIKTLLLDGRLRFNAAVFNSSHSDYQVQAQTPIEATGGSTLTILNAEELTSQGFEVEVEFLATDWLRVWGSYGYADVEFDKFIGCTRNGLNNQDCSGNQPADSPKVNYNFGSELTFATSGGEIYANAQYFWRDEMYSNPGNDANTLNKEYGELSGRIGWRSADDQWAISLWGKNLTEEEEQIYTLPSFLQANTAVYNMPRTFGVSLKWNLGN